MSVSIPENHPANKDHCELCGSTDYEDLHTGDQGYTACCNEPICHAGCVEGGGSPWSSVWR